MINVLKIRKEFWKDVKKKRLILNWEKCHFMTTSKIILGHAVSSNGIEVNETQLEVISNLPSLGRSVFLLDVSSFIGGI